MTTEEIKAAVDRFPTANPVLSDANKPAMDEAVAALHKGGKAAIEGLIALLVERDPTADSKARHALHALVHHVWTIKDDAARTALAATMAAPLGGDKAREIQAFLLTQIQLCGGKEVTAKVGQVLLDPELCDPACAALVAIREGAGPVLRSALPKATGRMKLAIVQALGAIKDVAASDALRAAMKDEDRDTRIAAGWGLASIGDTASIDLLIQSTTAAQGYERQQAVKHCLMLAEHLVAGGRKVDAAKLYRHLHNSRTDAKELYIREAAVRGLEAAGMQLKDVVN